MTRPTAQATPTKEEEESPDPRPVDQRRAQLRRRLGRPDRGDPAEHRGDRARRPPGPAQDRGALAADRLRVRPGSAAPTTSSSGSSRPTAASSSRSCSSSRGRSRTRRSTREGYWCGFGNNPDTGQPMTTSEWLDRLAPKATGRPRGRAPAPPTAASTPWPATRPARWACPTTSAGTGSPRPGIPIVCVPGCPIQPGQPVRDDPLPALPGHRPGADDPARRGAAAARGCSARPCTRAATAPATTSRATSPPSTARRSASSSSAAGARS